MHPSAGEPARASKELVLRPRPKHSAPIIVLAAFLFVVFAALGIGLISGGNPGGIVICLGIAALPIGLALYYRNAALVANSAVVGMRNLFGGETTCPREEFDRIEIRGAGTPTFYFLRKGGKTAFHVIARWWADDQIAELEHYLGLGTAD